MDTSSNNFNGKIQSTRNKLVQHDSIGLRKTHPGDNQIPQWHGFRATNRSYNTTTPTSQADLSISTLNVSKSAERANTTNPTRADVQGEAKKRRTLMTRTKTGCGTCRKRRKKCDEARPECKNCERGGLRCESYVNTKLLPRIRVAKPLSLLQTQKQVPTVILKHNSRFPGSDLRYILNSEPGVDSSPTTHGDSYPSIESTTGLDQRDTSAKLNPQALASTGQGDPSLPRVWYMPPLPTPTIGHYRDVTNKTCQVAYSGSPPRPQKTEKWKMFNGEPFLPYDSQLVDERAKCAAVVHSFNSTGIASNRMMKTAQDCFEEIVKARWIQPRYKESPVSGYLGVGVHVATPFYCDYGYNISIDDNVVIGPGCQLLDAAKITIGKDAKIGAGVVITTLETPKDPNALKGVCGTEVAKGISIGANVYIGDSCIVGAGVRIGNGYIIGSGSVIVHDILPDCIARGNPAS
jgi:acetyltransferase-like isoleucine patch superfamily enzyme